MVELIFVSQILGVVAGMVCLFWGTRYFYKMYVNKKLMNEIRKLTSRVSVLKLMLRARLRKNCNSLSKILNGEKALLEKFQDKYETLANFDLNASEHYQKIVSTLNEIANEAEAFFEKKYRSAADVVAHQNETQKQNANKEEKVVEFENVINFDLPCLIMVREIVLNQTASRVLIEKFNFLQESKKEEMKIPIELKIDNQDILFDLIDRAHEKKKSTKVTEADPEFEIHDVDHREDNLDEVKSA